MACSSDPAGSASGSSQPSQAQLRILSSRFWWEGGGTWVPPRLPAGRLCSAACVGAGEALWHGLQACAAVVGREPCSASRLLTKTLTFALQHPGGAEAA